VSDGAGNHLGVRLMRLSVAVIVASLAALGSWRPSVGSDAKAKPEKPAYLVPYGLTAEDLGTTKAPRFLVAVLGKGTDAEQEADLAVFIQDTKEAIDEITRLSEEFRKEKRGVQAVVWRDTRTGKLKRADDKTRFDPERDRVEFLFARLDLRAIQAQPANANPLTPESQKWVAGLAQAAGKASKDLHALQALPGILGGSGAPASGNIIPVYGKAKRKIEEFQESPTIGFVRGLRSLDSIVLIHVVCEYPDKTARIPSRISFWMTLEGGGTSGRFVKNREK
ncbi:MAG: hypothetical protein L0170_10560, partial [Acidobacteria bacterium]|nr:hypothetical protein [Acidobacteriota bacterium]